MATQFREVTLYDGIKKEDVLLGKDESVTSRV